MEQERPNRDIYGRKPVSNSQGRTAPRILERSAPPGSIPGFDALLNECAEGTVGWAIALYAKRYVSTLSFTPQRLQQRMLVFLVRDLSEDPASVLSQPVESLSYERLLANLDWRVSRGFTDHMELSRAAVHLSRLASWIARNCVAKDNHQIIPRLDVDRALFRDYARELIAKIN